MPDAEPNSFEDFSARFAALAEEAKQYFIHCCVVVEAENPISGELQISEVLTGGRIRAIGMLQQALWHLQQSG